MSLVYGDISSTKKDEIANEIKLNTTSFKAARLCIIAVDNMDPKTWLHVLQGLTLHISEYYLKV